MPDSWRASTLGNIAKSGAGLVDGPFGSNLPSSEYVHDGVPVIRGSNLSLGTTRFNDSDFVFVSEHTAQRLCRSLCSAGDIVFTKKGTLGQTALVPGYARYRQYLLSSNQMRLTVDRSVADPLFVYYYVSSPASRAKIIRDSEATGVPKTNLAYLRDFPILLPSLAEQRGIATLLGALDDKIELNRKMSATLEAMARALFKAWFVDFDPVRAKAEGSNPGLPDEVRALFPDSFEDSELGELPKGWEARPLPEAVEVNPTISLNGVSEAPYLDMANVPTSGYAVGRVITRAVSSGSRFQNGDTLVARITPCLENGKTAFVDFLAEGQVGWGSTEFIVLRPRGPLPAEYGYLLARSEGFRSFAIAKMTGSSGRQRVPVDALVSFFVAMPPSVVSNALASIVQPMFKRISAASRESRTLAMLRDALLPKLISGEIRVREAERIVEKSA